MKNILLYGLCHTDFVNQIMKKNPLYLAKYNNKYLINYTFRLNPQAAPDETHKQIMVADIIIYQKVNIKYGIWSTNELFKHAKPECQFICIPNIFNTALFPLCKLGNYLGNKVFGLETIKECLTKGDALDEIINKYNENKLDWHYQERFNDNIERALIEEKNADVKYIDFFLKNYKDYQLFKDALHASQPMYIFIANQVLNILDISGPYMDPFEPSQIIDNYFFGHYYSTSADLFYNFKWQTVDANKNSGNANYIDQIKKLYNELSDNNTINQISQPF